jgi:hypothetical protein
MSWLRLAPERTRNSVCMSSRALAAAWASTVVSVENSPTVTPRMASAHSTATRATPSCRFRLADRAGLVVFMVLARRCRSRVSW